MLGNFMGRMGSGQRVVDRSNSHIHPGVLSLISEVLRKIHFYGEIDAIQVDFENVVGNSIRVSTSTEDEIIYAMRPSSKGRGLTRFVKNREPRPSKSVTVILMKAKWADNLYVLISAFIGEKPEPEPWDPHATAQSVSFWNHNALVWGSEEIIPGTETTVCPW